MGIRISENARGYSRVPGDSSGGGRADELQPPTERNRGQPKTVRRGNATDVSAREILHL